MRRLRTKKLTKRLVLVLALMVVLGFGALWLPLLWPGGIEARYSVRVDLAGGRAYVNAELGSLRHPMLPLWLLGEAEHMAMTELEAGPPNAPKWLIGWDRWRLAAPWGADRLQLRYTVRLGVLGRHGYQGRIENDFALLPTRLLMWLPSPYWTVARVLLKVEADPGEDILMAWPEREDGWHEAALENTPVHRVVSKGVVAVGPFDLATLEAGGQAMEVATHERFSEALRQQARQRSLAIFSHMQGLLGFELRNRYLNIFVPPASDGKNIMGGSWSFGHAYEMRINSLRRWELFAHRIGHVFNRDPPHGLTLQNPHDLWFNEGLASWIEVPLTVAAGIAEDDARFSRLFRRYWRQRVQKSDAFDQAPIHDSNHTDHDLVEWLHYVKYPLVVQMLDFELRQSLGQSRGVEAFFAHLFSRYGYHQKPIPDLRTELEAFAGTALDPFFDRYVQDNWPLLPLWHAALSGAADVQAKLPVVAHVNGRPVFGTRQLSRQLHRSPATAQTTAQRLLKETAAGILLKRMGLPDVPRPLAEVIAGLSDTQRAAVVAHRLRALADQGDHGCLGPSTGLERWLEQELKGMQVVWGQKFKQLARAEPAF